MSDTKIETTKYGSFDHFQSVGLDFYRSSPPQVAKLVEVSCCYLVFAKRIKTYPIDADVPSNFHARGCSEF